MARDIRVTVVLNRIELIQLGKLCAKHKVKRSTILRDILAWFLDQPIHEQTSILQRAAAISPRRFERRPNRKPETLPTSRSRSNNRNPRKTSKGFDQGGPPSGHPHL